MVQKSVLIIATLEIILQKIRNRNISVVGDLSIFTMGNTQIQHIQGCAFLTSYHDISCFEMVSLKHSVRSFNNAPFVLIEKNAQFSCQIFRNRPSLIDKLVLLCSEISICG